ncbi:MAG: bifunctional glutamate N-acetyltransferase/amino-acid acetyltransferase ArgJ [Candidatus Omnitrophota bacterium]
MKTVSGGVTAAKGFLAAGLNCRIKFKKKDLALIYSEVPAVACGVFTQNKVQAAPVTVTRAYLRNHRAQAIIANSGNANCCTGIQGIKDAQSVAVATAKILGLAKNQVLVASTGIIGKRLPVDRIKQKLDILAAGLSREGQKDAAYAILTTDTQPKQVAVKIKCGGREITLGGMAKGAGMIAPHMATMLAFITTDALIDGLRLQRALAQAVEHSFNLITIDGDMSTNDMALVLANGLAGNQPLKQKEYAQFQSALRYVCLELAKMIVKDAEGAKKFVRIRVEGAKSLVQAQKVAFKIANSPLVKTAICGENPNWGRVAASVGSADQDVSQEKLAIYLGPLKVMHRGAAVKADHQKLNSLFKAAEIDIRVNLGLGEFSQCVFTCDLTEKYVKINAEY